MVPKPSVRRDRSGNQNSSFPLQDSMKNDALMNGCLVVLEKQIFLGVMSLLLIASCQDKTVSVQHEDFPRSLWLHINWSSPLTVWCYWLACTIQWSNKPNKWNMNSTVTKGGKKKQKTNKNLGERQSLSLSLVTGSVFKLCWIWLGWHCGMW